MNKDISVYILGTGTKMSTKSVLKIIGLMVIMGVATQFIASVLLTAILDLMPSVANEYNEDISGLLTLTPVMILYVCVMSPILEELFFRGLVFGILRRFGTLLIANITQALVFGIYHGNLVQGVYAFILGLFIGWIRYITDSIVYVMAMHMSINIVGLFISNIFPDEITILTRVLIVLVALVVGIVDYLQLIKCCKERDEQQ